MIDLNAAAPEVLALVARDIGISNGGLEGYYTWRAEGNRLHSSRHFLHVTGADAARLSRLQSYATIYSGRRGVAVQIAPVAVLEVLTGRRGTLAELAPLVPPQFYAKPNRVNFLVLWDGRSVGVLHTGGNKRLLLAG